MPAWAWLSPVAACLMLVMVLSGLQPGVPVAANLDRSPMVAMILSNQSYAPYLPGSFQRSKNRLRDTFEWTNTGRYPSSGGPFLRSE